MVNKSKSRRGAAAPIDLRKLASFLRSKKRVRGNGMWDSIKDTFIQWFNPAQKTTAYKNEKKREDAQRAAQGLPPEEEVGFNAYRRMDELMRKQKTAPARPPPPVDTRSPLDIEAAKFGPNPYQSLINRLRPYADGKTATPPELRSEFRRASVALHPDKHPAEKEKYTKWYQQLVNVKGFGLKKRNKFI